MTVRFGKNLGIGVIQGKGTLDCEKMTRIMIHKIFRYNKNQQISSVDPEGGQGVQTPSGKSQAI